MEYHKKRRSPRRDYSRGETYLSPNRRHQRSRSRSRSPYRRSSPFERRPSRTSPKQRRSRSRTPQRGYREKVNGFRRSRSMERKSRMDVEKPQYWGPNDPKALARVMSSPHRLVVVKKTGYEDDNGGPNGNAPTEKRITNEIRANADDQDGLKRYVYLKERKKETTDRIYTNYSRRNREDRHSPVSGTYGEKDFGRPRGSDRSEECDRTERYRKPYERKNSRKSNDRCYNGGRSRSLHRSENSRDKRHQEREDEKKTRINRDRRQRDHRYQNEDRKKSDEKNSDSQQSVEEEIDENEETECVDNNVMNGSLAAGITIRPPFVPPYARVVPIPPFIPPFRPPPMLPRFPPPFLPPRPFRIPPPRVFPQNRFYPSVPMY